MLTGRGLLGALLTFLAMLVLLLCLTETRQIGHLTQWGLYYHGRTSQTSHFGFWFPLILNSFCTVPFGYLLGDRFYTPRVWPGAVLGALVGGALLLLLANSNPVGRAKADENNLWIAALSGLVIGAGLGAEAAKRLMARRR
jgi:hypothetical protein